MRRSASCRSSSSATEFLARVLLCLAPNVGPVRAGLLDLTRVVRTKQQPRERDRKANRLNAIKGPTSTIETCDLLRRNQTLNRTN
jgi:hypothetical protein